MKATKAREITENSQKYSEEIRKIFKEIKKEARKGVSSIDYEIDNIDKDIIITNENNNLLATVSATVNKQIKNKELFLSKIKIDLIEKKIIYPYGSSYIHFEEDNLISFQIAV